MARCITKYQIVELAPNGQAEVITIFDNLKTLITGLKKRIIDRKGNMIVEILTNYNTEIGDFLGGWDYGPHREVIYYDHSDDSFELYDVRYQNHPISKRILSVQRKLSKELIAFDYWDNKPF